MAVRLDEMKARTKTLVVNWDGETVDVSYYPNVVTPDLLDQVDEAVKSDEKHVLGILLVPVIDWWDILLEDGSRLPVTNETIQGVPMSFLNRLQSALQEAQNPPA